MQFFKNSLTAFILVSACATAVFVSASVAPPDPTTVPYYPTAHSLQCSDVATGYEDIASEAECSALVTWLQEEYYGSGSATFATENNDAYGSGCIAFSPDSLSDPVPIVWNAHPTGNSGDTTSLKLCKNSK
jgi:hypothetical protein